MIVLDSISLGFRLRQALRQRFPDETQARRRRLRPDAYAPDAPACACRSRRSRAAKSPERARGPAAGSSAGSAQELLARQLDEQIAAGFEVGQRTAGARRRPRPGRTGTAAGACRARGDRSGIGSAICVSCSRSSWPPSPTGYVSVCAWSRAAAEDTGAHFLPGTFDVVLCHGGLVQARDPGPTLAGLARVLDAGRAAVPADTERRRAGHAPGPRGRLGRGAGGLRLPRARRAVPSRLETLTRGAGRDRHAAAAVVRGGGLRPRPTFPADDEEAERMLAAEERAGAPIRTVRWPRCCTCAGHAAADGRTPSRSLPDPAGPAG